MPSLEKRHQTEERAFARLRKLCESKVARWEYWTGENWHWDPEYPLKYADKPYSARRTTKEKALCIYGLDKLGRVVVMKSGCLWEKDESAINHDFLRYSGNSLVGSCFFGNDLLYVYDARLNEGRVVHVELFGPEPWSWKDIEWRGDKVSKVIIGNGKRAEFEVAYDEIGRVISDVDLIKAQIKPLPLGLTLQSLSDEIRKSLASAVIKTASRARIKDAVYCLVLAYDGEGNGIFPVEIGFGLEVERQEWLSKHGPTARQKIWNPAEFKHYGKKPTQLRDKRLDKLSSMLNQELERRGSDAPARRLVNEVAAKLGKADWSGRLNTTDDFVVYAVDFELGDLKKNLKFSVPGERLKKLKAAKLL
jgi:hypothetical protein